jgi:D-alanyl-D-alanine carboxypeptidase/D-alanyl-D-alanine-endopeptidase (penicillin-binding protein 4)
MRLFSYASFLLSYFLFVSSCSVSKQVARQADKLLLKDSAIMTGFIGISIYEPATGKYWYQHDAEKYFVPASNTKLFTLYAGMKYLGDSLVGLRYFDLNDSTTIIQSSGDPTFLHPDFKNQRVFSFLKGKQKITRTFSAFQDFLGGGWGWDDYKEYYMVQKNDFPVYGNILSVRRINNDSVAVLPPVFAKNVSVQESLKTGFEITKSWDNNEIILKNGNRQSADIPFRPDILTINALLDDTLKKRVETDFTKYERERFHIIRSQPTDSLFRIMMHRSDNFFAEQTLLMVSNEQLGFMDDEAIIRTLLDADLKEVPQKPQWVDGSGLSRYNLFSPNDFIYILEKIKNEFGFERIKNILAAGGTGTLKNYFIQDGPFIHAKTGTLSNYVALSGYLITKKKRVLIFSAIANHYLTGATPVRKAVEKFLHGIRERY